MEADREPCLAIGGPDVQFRTKQLSNDVASGVSPLPPLKRRDSPAEAEIADEEPHSYPLEDKPLTRENILECLPSAPVIPQGGFGGCIVARVRSDVVVKYGARRVHINEANTMRLVRQRTSVALPEVLDAWTATGTGQVRFERGTDDLPVTYIVMRYVAGTALQDMWPSMTVAERKRLVKRVADMLRELRTVEMDRPGPVGEPIRCEAMYFTEYNAGPFVTKEDLAYWLNNRLQVCKDFRRVPEDRPKLVVERLVLCHMDLNERNIIVAKDGSPWLVDWGCAGAYPPCFEYGVMRGGEFADMLKEEIYVDEDGPFLARLEEMTFAFTTGAMSRRYDMDFGEE